MSKNANFDKIMHEISSGLTGEPEKDLDYLKEQMGRFKDHEMEKEIVRACARMAYDLLPDDRKEEFGRIMDNGATGYRAVLDEVQFNIYKGNPDKALALLEPLVRQLEAADAFEDDRVSEFHTFDENFEVLLFLFRNQPEKEIRDPSIPFAMIYWLYGSLLFELKRYDDARAALEKGLRWNPVSTKMLFEYAEVFKASKDMDTFLKVTRDAFKVSFRRADLARCYRNMGFFFIEKEMFSEAYTCYLLSGEFDEYSSQMQSELFFISQVSNGKAKGLSREAFEACAEKYGFPVGPDENVIALAYNYGKLYFDKKEAEPAAYYLKIAYDLTENNQIKSLLDQILPDEEKKEAV